jgi:hypothetical protein
VASLVGHHPSLERGIAVGTWSEVGVGDVIQDKNGRAWNVTAVDGGSFTIEKGGSVHTVTPRTPEVTVLLSRRKAERTARALVQVHLGGAVQAVPGGAGKPFACPVEYSNPGSLAAHCFLFHGVVTDREDLADMLADHADMHRPEAKRMAGYENHVHTPRFAGMLA